MDIEKVATETPEKIVTSKIDLKDEGPSEIEIQNIISVFKLKKEQIETAKKLIKSLDSQKSPRWEVHTYLL